MFKVAAFFAKISHVLGGLPLTYLLGALGKLLKASDLTLDLKQKLASKKLSTGHTDGRFTRFRVAGIQSSPLLGPWLIADGLNRLIRLETGVFSFLLKYQLRSRH